MPEHSFEVKLVRKDSGRFWVFPDGREVKHRLLTAEEISAIRDRAKRCEQVADVGFADSIANIGVPIGQHSS